MTYVYYLNWVMACVMTGLAVYFAVKGIYAFAVSDVLLAALNVLCAWGLGNSMQDL